MSRLYKITYVLILIIWGLIALAAISETYRHSVWFVWLIFFLPLLWTIWLLFPALDTKRTLWQVLLLWGLVDATVLAVLSLLMLGTENMNGPSGEDVVLFVLFLPLDIPLLLASYVIPMFGDGLALIASATAAFFVGVKGSMADWVGMSVMVAPVSITYLVLCRFLRSRNNNHKVLE